MSDTADYEGFIVGRIRAAGAEETGVMPAALLKFDRAYRERCVQNLCGNYNRSWTCPPHCGPPDALEREIMSYSTAVLFMVSGPLRFEVDWKSMMKVAARLNSVCAEISDSLAPALGGGAVFGYGPCRYCESCTFKAKLPCRCPEKRIRSMECACIDVSDALGRCGMKLVFDPDRISFTGLFACNLGQP
jgi:predicted metal-binding protein